MANTINDSAIKKLKLLFTVVDRSKAEFYLDFISQFEVNCQMVVAGTGTAKSQFIDKGVSFAVPLSSVIGVNLYQFLSNNRLKRGEQQ